MQRDEGGGGIETKEVASERTAAAASVVVAGRPEGTSPERNESRATIALGNARLLSATSRKAMGKLTPQSARSCWASKDRARLFPPGSGKKNLRRYIFFQDRFESRAIGE